jgi:hypothetical protein
MQFTYTLTLKDYKAALQLHRRERIGRRIYFCLFSLAVPILVIIPLIALLILIYGRRGSTLNYVFVPDFILLLIIYKFRERYILLCSSINQDLTLYLDDEGIRSVNPDVSDGKTYWKAIYSTVQDEKVMLLCATDKTIILVPKREMSPEQRTELSDLVARHVVKRKP